MPLLRTAKRAAFSLVEVTLAIGVVAVAFLGVMGLLPTGLTTFRRSMDTSIGTQIADRLLSEAQQTDFSVLVGSQAGSPASFVQPNPNPALGNSKMRYFDDQGNELSVAAGALYQVQTLITPATTLPASGSATSNVNLATVTIQIANNPASRDFQPDGSTHLWTNPSIPIATYTGMVSKNK